MSKELYETAARGEWELLTHRLEELDPEKLFLACLPDGSNIFHIAVENSPLDFKPDFSLKFLDGPCSKERFVMEALKKFPILTCQTNRRGQTPLHLAMVRRILKPQGMLFAFLEDQFKQMKDQASYVPLPPWKVKDVDGNTLIHLALKYGRFTFARNLINLDAEVAGEINNSKETPLHMLCQNVGKGKFSSLLFPLYMFESNSLEIFYLLLVRLSFLHRNFTELIRPLFLHSFFRFTILRSKSM